MSPSTPSASPFARLSLRVCRRRHPRSIRPLFLRHWARLAQDWFRAGKQAPHSFLEVRTLEACSAAVSAGLGVSILPGVMAAQPMRGVTYLPLDPPVVRQVAVIEHKNRVANPEVDRVRSALLQCIAVTGQPALTTPAVTKLAGHRRSQA